MPEQRMHFFAQAIFGSRTKKGLVEIHLGDSRFTVEPFKAREMAIMLLECAGAAEGDEVLMRAATKIGLTIEAAAQLLRVMRSERQLVDAAARKQAAEQTPKDQAQAGEL